MPPVREPFRDTGGEVWFKRGHENLERVLTNYNSLETDLDSGPLKCPCILQQLRAGTPHAFHQIPTCLAKDMLGTCAFLE